MTGSTVFDETRLSDREALDSVDDALRAIASWGAVVRRADAAAATSLAAIEADPPARPRAVLAAGPDGRLLRTVLEPVCPVPFVAWPHGGLPGWAGPLDLVVVLATTGNGTAHDRASVTEAVRRGCEVLLVCPPDSALHEIADGRGWVLPAGSGDALAASIPALRALHSLGLGPEVSAEPVASALDRVAQRCGPDSPIDENPAKELALAVADRLPVLWGGSALASRAARRLAEGLRAATGVPAVAGVADQLVPLLAAAPERDLFADPFDDPVGGATAAAPVLVVLDDPAAGPAGEQEQERLEQTARARGVAVHRVVVDDDADIARFASLLAVGRFAAVYLGLGTGEA